MPDLPPCRPSRSGYPYYPHCSFYPQPQPHRRRQGPENDESKRLAPETGYGYGRKHGREPERDFQPPKPATTTTTPQRRSTILIACLAAALGIFLLFCVWPQTHASAPAHRGRARDGGRSPAQVVPPSEEAVTRVCRAHHHVSSLPFAEAASWPTLAEFISVDVSAPPFRGSDASSSRESRAAGDGGGFGKFFTPQNKAVLDGWVAAYEHLTDSRVTAGDDDPGTKGRVADAMSLVAVTLQDPDARALYVYRLLPKMEEAGSRGLAKRHGRDAALADPGERKEIMMAWLRDYCLQNGAWPGRGGER